jgi:hypothetical protein
VGTYFEGYINGYADYDGVSQKILEDVYESFQEYMISVREFQGSQRIGARLQDVWYLVDAALFSGFRCNAAIPESKTSFMVTTGCGVQLKQCHQSRAFKDDAAYYHVNTFNGLASGIGIVRPLPFMLFAENCEIVVKDSALIFPNFIEMSVSAETCQSILPYREVLQALLFMPSKSYLYALFYVREGSNKHVFRKFHSVVCFLWFEPRIN